MTTAIGHSLKDELRDIVLSLTEACPLAECKPKDSPLYLLRKMKRQQRIKWFNALDEDDLTYLVMYHHVCLSIRAAFNLDEETS